MAGVLVPVVLMRRFTTLVGAADYSTVAIEVKDYQNAILSVWRGPAKDTLTFFVEESFDQKSWTLCSGAEADWDPGASAEDQVTAALTKRWLRVRAVLLGLNARASCWVLGFLERRER
ncbi:MAG TPA: hypothetical protein VI997_11080 [Candidatus Thermoplasmatota archaeon]|nr:hypothetical protein [Candidatus Thermoplasmatota archaeon]